MLNELEIFYFTYFLDNLGWDYITLIQDINNLPEFIINVEVKDF